MSPDQSVSLILQEALAAIGRRWRLVAGVYFGVVSTAIVGIFLMPPTYRAAGKILLSTDRAEISTRADRGTELVRTNQVSDSEINSQLQILRSRELIESVLASMDAPAPSEGDGVSPSWLRRMLHAPSAFVRSAYRRMHGIEELTGDDPLYWRTRNVLAYLETTSVRSSSVVEVAFAGSDPAWAQELVNRLMSAYVEHHAKMQQISDAQEFFEEQSVLLRRKLAESETALQQLRERLGSFAGQDEEVHQRLNEFTAELSRTRVARLGQERQVAFLENVFKHRRVASPELLALEARRASMVGKYRADSERMRDIENQIARLRNTVASYDAVTGAATEELSSPEAGGVALPGVVAVKNADLVEARAALANLKGRESELGRTTEEYRAQAEFLDAQHFELTRLERQVKQDEEAYLSYVRSAEQSRLSNAIEQSRLLRLRIIEPASLPLEASSPMKGRIIMVALLGGLAAAFGVGLVRDHLDGTVKGSGDIRRYAGLETLTIVPDRS